MPFISIHVYRYTDIVVCYINLAIYDHTSVIHTTYSVKRVAVLGVGGWSRKQPII